MAVNEIQYRELGIDDVSPDILKDFNRYQVVTKSWRKRGDEYMLEDTPFIDDWSAEKKYNTATIGFPEAIRSNGCVFGAYDGNKLIGFAVINGGFIGREKQYLQIENMQVSFEYRHKGIGRKLFLLCIEKGYTLSAQKLYISAQSSQESQAFYQAMGCVYATEVIPELFEQEPFDVHMEYCLDHKVKIFLLPVGKGTKHCSSIIRWAETWDWGVGKILANRLYHNGYSGWESAFLAIIDGQYAGFCALEKKDEYGTDLDFTRITPFIGAVYVDPQFRGHRVSEKLLKAACDYAHSLGFNAIFLISSHVGFYEKYGFEPFTQTTTISGSKE